MGVIEHALQQFGQVRRRTWGDVVSIELGNEVKRKVFSFQIAARAGHLQPPVSAQWQDVLLDSFNDLIASKMMALVNRGAPRDFRDIYTVCQTEMITLEACWQLWQQRQEMSGNELEVERACIAVLTHLARIEQQRPLANISDVMQRAQAENVRNWFKKEFVNAGLV